MTTRVDQLMTRSIVTVELDDTLDTIKQIFDSTRFHHLLVVENEQLMGIVSDRDFLKQICPTLGTPAETRQDLATLNKKAHQIMTRKPICLPPTADFYDAIHIFNEFNFSCLPIVDGQNRPLGILSWRDLFRHLAKSGSGHSRYLDILKQTDTR